MCVAIVRLGGEFHEPGFELFSGRCGVDSSSPQISAKISAILRDSPHLLRNSPPFSAILHTFSAILRHSPHLLRNSTHSPQFSSILCISLAQCQSPQISAILRKTAATAAQTNVKLLARETPYVLQSYTSKGI